MVRLCCDVLVECEVRGMFFFSWNNRRRSHNLNLCLLEIAHPPTVPLPSLFVCNASTPRHLRFFRSNVFGMSVLLCDWSDGVHVWLILCVANLGTTILAKGVLCSGRVDVI